jgi:oligoribonuclease NrnB/cAMP/cGMP phosphodiesterase (DHH superfamily)
MSKPLIIYHNNCADGFGAAWVFSRHGFADAQFHGGTYQNDPPDIAGRDVYLLDFSYKRPVVESILESANSVTLIDHHKTALDDLEPVMPRIKCHCGLDHSGAVLAWQFLCGAEPPPQLLLHIEDRDLWRFSIPNTRQIQANVFSHPYDFAVWDELMQRPVDELVAEGNAIERKHFKDIDELVAAFRHRRRIGGYVVPVANLPYTLTSDAGHLMATGEPFAACYWDTPEGRVYSLRSADNGVDVSEIAKQYGGGGHRNASGFRVPYTHELAMAPIADELLRGEK